jgi:hypothetical protein
MNLKLYHSSKNIINKPDIYHGRSNADFGKGFYLSLDLDFSKKWNSGTDSYINIYELDLTNLNIKYLNQNTEWFNYILNNRQNNDVFKDYDLIIGPISNDTLFDTFGLLTSGYIKDKKALKVLKQGPKYIQVVIKSEKALNNLKFINYINETEDEIIHFKAIVKKEEKKFLNKFYKILRKETKILR